MNPVVRDTLAVALIAGLVFQTLRRCVGDRYVVPSGSMQPTIYGATTAGDVVFVDKTAAASGLRRYDLGVFRSPDDDGVLVKRVVAFGDDRDACRLDLRDGDLWLGPDEQHLRRITKDPLADRDLRVPWLEWPPRVPGTDDALVGPLGGATAGGIALPQFEHDTDARTACREDSRRAAAEALARGDRNGLAWLQTVRAIDACYLDREGRRGDEGASVTVDDIGADFELDDGGIRALCCTVDLRPDSWTLCWQPASGEVELWRNGDTVARHRLPPAPRRTRVEFGHLDGRFFLAIAGTAERLWVEARRPEWLVPDPGPQGWSLPRNRLAIAAIGGSARLVRLQVFRDIHWFRPALAIGVDPAHWTPVKTVRPGHVYLLGDNGVDSRDSRMFGDVPLADFVGRPRYVIAPWHRRRGLDR